MKNIMKLGSILFIICSIAAILLGLTNNITSPIIKKEMKLIIMKVEN